MDRFDMDFENRIVTPEYTGADAETEFSLRPRTLAEYIGQDKAKENLSIYIEAAKMRDENLDHVLLYGPPGLGKTTLSTIIANEMNVNIRVTSGPAIEKQGDLAALLTNLSENDILFIDEIHRLNRSVEEVLYPAMEDFALDIIIGKGLRRGRSASTCPSLHWWGHHPGRTAYRTAPGSLWRDPAPGALHGGAAHRDRHPQCRDPGDRM